MSAEIVGRDLWKAFQRSDGTSLPIFEGVELDVAEHEFVALVGPSGCGKSTLLSMLAGFDRPDRGAITLGGRPVTRPTPRGIMITQRGSVFPWLSVRRNLTIVQQGVPDEEQIRHAAHYLQLVGLQEFGLSFPYQLSGGMLQRLELARALVVRPDVLFMDEPFGALDALTRIRLRQELLRIRRDEPQTTVLVTHDVDEAIALADRIFVLSERPMRIRRTITVGMAHPRSISDPRAVAIKEEVLRLLGAVDG